MSRGFLELGASSADPGASLTLLLIGPDFVAEAKKLGFDPTDDAVKAKAEAWIAADAHGGKATPAAVEITRDAMAVDYLVRAKEGLAALSTIEAKAEAGIVASPRYGAFTAAVFDKNFVAAIKQGSTDSPDLSTWYFTVFDQLNGFDGASPPWFTGG
jgi:hypothetical protein